MSSYKHITAVGTSLREVKSALLNNWRTVLMTKNGYFVSRKYEDIEIYDRTGGGDSFASSLIWGLLEGKPEQEVIDFAAAFSALCHTVRNDWNIVSAEEAYELMAGGSARVKR
jgi:2-dehydro-3-deoxygluconokinase